MIKRYIAGLLGVIAALFIFPATSEAQSASAPKINIDGRRNVQGSVLPFLRISSDARSSGMGDAGLALSPDANSVFRNLSQLTFSEKTAGLSATYSPWLRDVIGDMFLAGLNGYHKLGEDQALGFSMRYFSLGTVQFRTIEGQDQGKVKANEMALDAGYARKLSDNWSMGIAFRYIYSNLGTAQTTTNQGVLYKPAHAVSADLSATYRSEVELDNGQNGEWSVGMKIADIGPKISYSNDANKYFLPTNLGIGVAYTHHADEDNKITFTVDLNKLLVPTADSTDPFSYNKNPLSAMLNSFNDAPGGFRDEIKEVTFSVGAEYWYNNQFALRAGYFHESVVNGNRKYFTSGAGLKLNATGINFSYLIPSGTGTMRNPLSNTMRFSLLFDLGNEK